MATIPPIAGFGAGEALTAAEHLGPAGADAATFSQALLDLPSAVSAPVAHPADSMGAHLASGLHDLSAKLASWHAADASTALPASGTSGEAGIKPLTAAMQDAVSSLEGSYAFAIGASLASRGSTETTKIMNTLLKGQ